MNKNSILIVDDEKAILDLLELAFSDFNISCFKANNGQEALDVYKENKNAIKAVLTDMEMPRIGGKQLFFKLKDLDPSLSVILFSGYSNNEDVQECLDNGAITFFYKPFKLKELISKVEEVIG
jgi:two-component system cell cycle sensor histidine kinase/response regulator CckA